MYVQRYRSLLIRNNLKYSIEKRYILIFLNNDNNHIYMNLFLVRMINNVFEKFGLFFNIDKKKNAKRKNCALLLTISYI